MTTKRPDSEGGGLQGGEEPGYGAADTGGALPVTKDGVQAVAAEMRFEEASERAADAWAEAAVAGDGASTGATILRLAGSGVRGITLGAAAAAAGGGGGPPQCGLPSLDLPRGHTPGGRGPGPDRGIGPGEGGGGPGGGGGPTPGGIGGGPPGRMLRAPSGRGGV